MPRVFLWLSLVTACLAYCPDPETGGYRNTEWQPNNVLIKLLNFFYDSIALTTADSCSPEKRYISVLTLAKTIFLANNDTDYEKSVTNAKIKAEKQLGKQAAALAGPFRGIIDRLLNVIDQPINDVLASCKPDTFQEECIANLIDYRTKYEKECKGYLKNVEIHNRATKWANRPDSIDYIEELIQKSKTGENDISALEFFEKGATTKYKSALAELQNIFSEVKYGTFNCNALSFVNINCI